MLRECSLAAYVDLVFDVPSLASVLYNGTIFSEVIDQFPLIVLSYCEFTYGVILVLKKFKLVKNQNRNVHLNLFMGHDIDKFSSYAPKHKPPYYQHVFLNLFISPLSYSKYPIKHEPSKYPSLIFGKN
jgi:hypothetical protein